MGTGEANPSQRWGFGSQWLNQDSPHEPQGKMAHRALSLSLSVEVSMDILYFLCQNPYFSNPQLHKLNNVTPPALQWQVPAPETLLRPGQGSSFTIT